MCDIPGSAPNLMQNRFYAHILQNNQYATEKRLQPSTIGAHLDYKMDFEI